MDPLAQQRPVSPFSVRGIVQGVQGAYGGAVDATSRAIEAAARPFTPPPGYTPAVAQPPAAVVAPAAVAPAAVAVQPQLGGLNLNAIQRREAAAGLKNGGQVGRDTKPARGARRAMPARGNQPAPAGVQRLANGGPVEDPEQVDQDPAGIVQGPGTGTSDSVPAEMPQGTYVMPADTTEDVQLSDGEFKVPPQVVMAAGAAALDVVRNFTHQEVAEGGAEQQQDPAEAGEPEGYMNGGQICPPGMAKGARRGKYADGGLITDEDRKSGPSVSTRIAQPAAPATPGGAVFGMYPSAAGSRHTTYARDAQLRTGQLADGSAPEQMNVGVRGLPRGVTPSTAGAGRGSVNPELANAGQAPQAAATPAVATTPTAATPSSPQVATGMVQGQASPPGSAGAEAAMGAEASGPASTSAQRIAAMGRAGQTYRDIAGMAAPGGNAVSIGSDPSVARNAQFDREELIRAAARMGGRGASAVLGLVAADGRQAADVATAGMREEGANTRAGMQESGATARENARLATQTQIETGRNDLDARRVGATEQETAVKVGVGRQQIAEGERMSRLRGKLDATTDPVARRQLQEQILAEQGKTLPANRYTVIPGGSGVDPTTGQVVRERSTVLDNQTGQMVDQHAGATTARVAPPAAAVAKLKSNPELAAAFDAKYGAGAAQRLLGR